MNIFFNNFFDKANEISKKMKELDNIMSKIIITGESGAGMIKVIMNGIGNVITINIDNDYLKKENKKLLQVLLGAAFNDANKKKEILKKENIDKIFKDMGLPSDIYNKFPFNF